MIGLRLRARALFGALALLVAPVAQAAGATPDRMAIPIPAAPGQFAGKFQLVPLFTKGHQPVVRNGHQYYAERNTIAFRLAAGDTVAAFAGSTTDLASIPRIVWSILPPDGAWAQAAAIHDPCYRTHGTFVWRGHVGRTRALPYSRAECDDILRQGMVALGVPGWKRVMIYEAVRVGGGSGWGH